MKSNLQNTQSGITLVALIITVIILLILAMVSISLVMNGNLIGKAKTAVDKYSQEEIGEQIKLAYSEWDIEKWTGTNENASDFIKNRLNSAIGNVEDVSLDDNTVTVTFNKNGEENIYYYNIKNGITKQIELAQNSTNKNNSYVGCYADIDDDGTVDGVIFVDLLTRSVRDVQEWGTNGYGAYTIPTDVTADNVNIYYISQESYTDSHFGTHKVISPMIKNGKQRFYIMQLSDFTTPEKTDGTETENYPAYTTYTWYKNAYNHMSPLITSNDFGMGKENTRKMIEKWNAAGTENGYADSPKDNQDIWKHIQTKYNEGWFIPSRAEWSAFANEIGGETPITISNYNSTYGLRMFYWSSSQLNSYIAMVALFRDHHPWYYEVTNMLSVRLATTF